MFVLGLSLGNESLECLVSDNIPFTSVTQKQSNTFLM